MADKASYLTYKKDTEELISWIIKSSNQIARLYSSAPSIFDVYVIEDGVVFAEELYLNPVTKLEINYTSWLDCRLIVPTCEIIARFAEPVPPRIYELFESVIAARTEANYIYKIVSNIYDFPELKRSNETHKGFIDILREAYEVLGGEDWRNKRKIIHKPQPTFQGPKTREPKVLKPTIPEPIIPAPKILEPDVNLQDNTEPRFEEDRGPWLVNRKSGHRRKESTEQRQFVTKFSALNIDDNESGHDDDDNVDNEPEEPIISTRTTTAKGPKTSPVRSRKKKKGKGKGKQRHENARTRKPSIDCLPLEDDLKVKENEDSSADFMVAACTAVHQFIELRHFLGKIWKKVIYKDLNSAVAGALSNCAVAMVKQTEAAIFVEFPGRDNYRAIFDAITQGDAKNSQQWFNKAFSHRISKERGSRFELEEAFLLYTYNDLLDFIKDFQNTSRSGKPSNRMLKEIGKWDHDFNLQSASYDERIRWRWAYTIKWLYDLINIFSSYVMHRIRVHGEKLDLSKIDWSKNGPWRKHKRIWGLGDFAGKLAGLVYQKSLVEILPRISTSFVFQLACIVDSYTISRGWSVHPFKGYELFTPVPGFRPTRDIDLFVDRDWMQPGSGYAEAMTLLMALLRNDKKLPRDKNRHEDLLGWLEQLYCEHLDWFGRTGDATHLEQISPSQFTSWNRNGLWEYSPYLCGVALVEALDLSYKMGMRLFDRLHEIPALVHVYNALEKMECLSYSSELFDSLSNMFREMIFPQGVIPETQFVQHYRDIAIGASPLRLRLASRIFNNNVAKLSNPGLPEILCPGLNLRFKDQSLINILVKANWDLERIPDEDIPPLSFIARLRLCRVKRTKDPVTGKDIIEDTPLVRNARKVGYTDQKISTMIDHLSGRFESQSGIDFKIGDFVPLLFGNQRFSSAPANRPTFSRPEARYGVVNCRLLSLFKQDLLDDITGCARPYSSQNWISVVNSILIVWGAIEKELERVGHPLWLIAKNDSRNGTVHGVVTPSILEGDDEVLMGIVTGVFEEFKLSWFGTTYWDDVESDDNDCEECEERGHVCTLEESVLCPIT